ncbi:Hpt domain-containing protein [Tautonia sociabilis]|uniref:Hpt domain-containing protein n=1 Tax=Tautonia sociabilis TaxID=2080755 RepID=UPI001315715E|nr:Hpt domain-containing protein [Tautonia sociabilis]
MAIALGGDEGLAREILLDYLASASQSVRRIGELLASGDLQRASAEAHGLKGSSATVGAQELSEACQRLETAAADQVDQAFAEVCSQWHRLRPFLERLGTGTPTVSPQSQEC